MYYQPYSIFICCNYYSCVFVTDVTSHCHSSFISKGKCRFLMYRVCQKNKPKQNRTKQQKTNKNIQNEKKSTGSKLNGKI